MTSIPLPGLAGAASPAGMQVTGVSREANTATCAWSLRASGCLAGNETRDLQHIVDRTFYRIIISCYISAHARNYYKALQDAD